jgi:hypothetical protein
MELNAKQVKVAVALVVVLVLCVGYFIWSRTLTPEPTLMPGQSVLNPMGTGAPGKAPAPTIRPGRPDPVYGPGPSSSAPIPGTR